MKKINNLDELEELIGREAVEKCFTEYMMLTIAKAHKWDELQGEDVFHKPNSPEWGDEMITVDDLTDEEIQQLEKNISDIKARKKHD